MAFNNPLTIPKDYVFGRGVAYFAPFDANNVPMGEVDLGELPSLVLAVTPETYTHKSKRTAIAKTDLKITTGVEFAAKLEFESISTQNLAMFLSGASSTVTQESASVTAERIYYARSGRDYQIGASASNPSGARGISAVSVYLHELKNATSRANSTAYTVGQIYKSSTNVFVVTAAGTSAGSAPSFNTTAVGDSTTDGGATVKYLGDTTAYTVDTDYLLSTEAARVGIVTTGELAAACNLYESVVPGSYLSLSVAYTAAANTRTQVASTNAGALKGQFRFIADNAEGTNRDLFIPSCNLAPSGDLPLITDADIAKASFELGINELDTDTAQVYIDGRPV